MIQRNAVVVRAQVGPRRDIVRRVTLAKAEFQDAGEPRDVRITYLGPEDEGGPAWIIQPIKG